MSTVLEQAREKVERMIDEAIRLRQAGDASPIQSLTGGRTAGFGFADDRTAQSAKTKYDRNTSWTYAAVRPIANRVAAQPIRVARVTRMSNERAMQSWELRRVPQHVKDYAAKTFHMPSSASLEILESHPFLDAMHDPNGIMTSYSLMYLLAASLQLAGRSFWWIVKSTRRKGLDIWSLPAHWVTPDSSEGFRTNWKVRPSGSMESFNVPGEAMANFCYPKVSDPFGSFSPVEAAARDILTDEAIKESQHRSFQNDIVPGLAIILGETAVGIDGKPARPQAESHQIEQLEVRLNQLYRGSGNSRRFIVLDSLIKDVQKISTNPNEMDYQKSGLMVKKAIMQIFGVNEIIAGEIEGANRASAVVADENFLSNVVNPLLSLVNGVINKTVLPLFRRGKEQIVAWIEDGTATDPAERRADWELGYRMRATTRDEFRADVLGLPPLPDGSGQSIVMGIAEIIQPVGEEQAAPISPEDDAEKRKQRGDDWLYGRRNLLWRRSSGKNKNGTLLQVRYHDAFLKLHGRNEDGLSRDLREFFRSQEKDVLRRLQEAGVPASAELLFHSAEWDEKLKDVVSPHLFRAALSGAELEREAFGIKQPEVFSQAELDEILIDLPHDVQVAIRNEVAETLEQPYWSEMNRTTLTRLDTAIQQSITEGFNLREMARLVSDALGIEASSTRAIATARTETTGALNSGSYAVRQDLASEGLVTGQEWLATLDSDTRDTHIAANGQQVGINDDFDVGGFKAPYPGHHSLPAIERVNCFLPDTIIAGEFSSGMKVAYSGQVAEIVFGSGRRLTVTPNHEILTTNGFVSACNLQRGDQIISDDRQVDRALLPCAVSDYVNHEQTTIEKVFESLLSLGSATGSVEVRGAHVNNFDGDGKFCQSDVKIVRPDWELLFDLVSREPDEVCDSIFTLKNSDLIPISSLRPLAFFFDAVRSSATSGMGGRALLDSLFISHSRPFYSLGIRTISRFNSIVAKNGIDDCSGSIETTRDGIDRLSAVELLADQRTIEGFLSVSPTVAFGLLSTIPDRDLVSGKDFLDRRERNVEFLRELVDGHASLVSTESVTSVEIREWAGHVYDLSSRTGCIIANGIYTSNCRCSAISITIVDDLSFSSQQTGRLLV